MSTICKNRLAEERKQWRKDHPFGFYARPDKNADGTLNILQWTAGIPGKKGTDWENGTYKISMTFPADYPSKPPFCKFIPPLFHVNVYPNGEICLSILNDSQDWKPSITLKQVLLDLLDTPNPLSAANSPAYNLFMKNKPEYSKRVKQEAVCNRPGDEL